MTLDEAQVPTTEDWYPTKDHHLTLSLNHLTNGVYRVCVWGEDDFGMELDTYDLTIAQQIFDTLKKSSDVTEEVCLSLSMVRA